MKVLICTGLFPPDIGGPATYSKLLFDELPNRGVDTDVLSFGEVRHLPYIIRHIAYFFKVLGRIKNVDVIFALDPLGAGLPAGFAAKISGKKFVLKIAGDRVWETGMQKYWTKKSLDEFSKTWKINPILWPVKIGQNLMVWLADAIATPSFYLKKIIMNWGVCEEKIRVIYNAFECPEIAGSAEDLRKRFGLFGFVIVSVSRLVPWKGFAALIDAMPEILKEIPEAKLFIIGSGPEHDNLKEKIKSLKLERNVFLLGQVLHGKVLEYLRAADVFALNTAYEGFSHLILEAMSLGVPVVTTDIGGNPEAITDGETGILVRVDDQDQIKKAVARLYEDKKLRNDLARNALEKAKEFGKERMLAALVEFFKSVKNKK